MVITVQHSEGFLNREFKQSEGFLTVVNPYVPSYLEKEVKSPGFIITAAVERKQNKYRGRFSATYTLLSLVM